MYYVAAKSVLIISIFILTITACSRISFPENQTYSDTLRVASYNIRLETSADKGEKSWNYRKKHIGNLIFSQAWDIFGVQEMADLSQETDIRRMLPYYACFSRGRDNQDGSSGERIGVFYNRQRFELQDSSFFFLSETPEIVSRGWDAALNRICIWVKIRDRVTNQTFYFVNTHFDHRGVIAREKSAELIISKIKHFEDTIPLIFVGDLNASPAEKAVYQRFNFILTDSKYASLRDLSTTQGTFNGWSTNDTYPENMRIDYIFTEGFIINSYQVIQKKFSKSGIYPSDHLPVEIECLFKK
jgi:endonuclease/exonuclease/phosphatase family metal-dependent hydrolase